MTCADIFLGLVAILFPPLAVWIKRGVCSGDSCINILLCMLGYLPGLIHAWYIISRYPEYDYDRVAPDDEERQGGDGTQVTYYYISQQPSGRWGRRWRGGAGYGTVPNNNKQPRLPPPRIIISSSSDDRLPITSAPSAAAADHTIAGPASGTGSGEPVAPPAYSEVVKGDHKIQRQE